MRTPLLVATTLLIGGGAVYALGRTYGASRAEQRAALPGDDVVAGPTVVCTHAITIDAPPERVWPWLVQIGWHRGGWYTARWVDRLLFPDNQASANRVIPELQQLKIGDFIPDGPPQTECGFTVLDVEPRQRLMLRSTTHLPLAWRRRNLAALEWTWVFVLRPVEHGTRTRFLFRWRARTTPWWLRLMCHAVVVPADLVMSRDMLRGVRIRAERLPQTAPPTERNTITD
jgi:hypothetical protein